MSRRSLNLSRPVSNHPSNQGLIGWWLALPGMVGGPKYWDISQYRNHATLQSFAPPSGPGNVVDGTNTRFGAIKCDGVNTHGAEASVANVPTLNLGNPLTISVWLQNVAGENAQCLSVCDSGIAGIGIRTKTPQNNVYGSALVYAYNPLPTYSSAGKWQLAYTQDAVNNNAYVNGILWQSNPYARSTVNFSRLWFAKNTYGGGSEVLAPGDLLGDARILNRASSKAEIAFLYQQRLRGYPDLLAYRSWVSFAKAAGSGATPVSGSGALTAGSTAAGTGTVQIAGAGAITAGSTVASTGGVLVSASGAITAGSTAAGTAAVRITGNGAITAGSTAAGAVTSAATAAGAITAGSTAAGTGTVRITGSGSITAGSTAAGTAAVLVTGNGAITASSVVSGTGTTTGSSTGAAALIAGSTVAGTGTVGIAGAGAITAGSTVAGSGSIQVTGSGSITAGSVASGTGTTGNVATGAGSITAGSVASGTGTVLVTGSGTITAGSVSGGTAAIKITGTGAITAGSVVSGTGTNGSAHVDTNVYVFYIGV